MANRHCRRADRHRRRRSRQRQRHPRGRHRTLGIPGLGFEGVGPEFRKGGGHILGGVGIHRTEHHRGWGRADRDPAVGDGAVAAIVRGQDRQFGRGGGDGGLLCRGREGDGGGRVSDRQAGGGHGAVGGLGPHGDRAAWGRRGLEQAGRRNRALGRGAQAPGQSRGGQQGLLELVRDRDGKKLGGSGRDGDGRRRQGHGGGRCRGGQGQVGTDQGTLRVSNGHRQGIGPRLGEGRGHGFRGIGSVGTESHRGRGHGPRAPGVGEGRLRAVVGSEDRQGHGGARPGPDGGGRGDGRRGIGDADL